MKKSDNPYTELLWLNDLKAYLETLLESIINERDIPLYVTDEAMKVWSIAFTHETYSPSDNYEDLEYLGDRVLKTVFPKYLMKKYPFLHKNDFTELDNIYMSKIKQAEFATKMGLGDYLRTKGLGKVILNLKTDVFESFFGALDTVSDMIAIGLGTVNCYNMIVELFRDVYIKESARNGPAKTQVEQIFSRFDLPKPRTHTGSGKEYTITMASTLTKYLQQQGIKISDPIIAQNGDGDQKDLNMQAINALKRYGLLEVNEIKQSGDTRYQKSFTIELTNEHINFLNNYRIKINKALIGEGRASTKKEAEVIAYDNALEFLTSLRSNLVPRGITRAWADDEKQRLDFTSPGIEENVYAASQKAASEGFNSFYFFISRKTANNVGAVVQLVGVKPDNKQEVLAYTYTGNENNSESKNNYQSAKALVLRDYIK